MSKRKIHFLHAKDVTHIFYIIGQLSLTIILPEKDWKTVHCSCRYFENKKNQIKEFQNL